MDCTFSRICAILVLVLWSVTKLDDVNMQSDAGSYASISGHESDMKF